MFDSDANGKVDEVKATFSETLEASNATAPWTLTNVPSDGTLGAVSTSGTGATLSINEGDGAAEHRSAHSRSPSPRAQAPYGTRTATRPASSPRLPAISPARC